MTTQAVMENHRPLTKPNTTHEVGNFDTEMFPEDRPWCMFNVMLISRADGQTGISYRDTIGRIHVDAFLAHGPHQELIDLE
jgi:hypothetical protein